MPTLYIITGSNGAGKSSIGKFYLPQHVQDSIPVFDGDKLFMDRRKELWASGITAIKESRNLAHDYVMETFDRLVNESLAANCDFAYEGHFTSEQNWETPIRFKQQGYAVKLVFFGLNDPDVSELRVVERANAGGHSVNRSMINENFHGNLLKLDKYYPILNDLSCFDTTGTEPILLLKMSEGKCLFLAEDVLLPAWFKTGLPGLNEYARKVL